MLTNLSNMADQDEIVETQPCPICAQHVNVSLIALHVDDCLEEQATSASLLLAASLAHHDPEISTQVSSKTTSRPPDSFAQQRQEYIALQKAKRAGSAVAPDAVPKRPCLDDVNASKQRPIAPIFQRQQPTIQTQLPIQHVPAAATSDSTSKQPAQASSQQFAPEPGHGGTELTTSLYAACRLEQQHRRGYGAVRAVVCQHVKHYQQQGQGRRYTCGYRNAQMMISHLLHHDTYRTCLFNGSGVVPSLSALQQALETAWQAGFDTLGAAQLNHRVVGTDKWIGASDVAALLRHQGVRAELIDFPSATPEQVGQWLWEHFCRHSYGSDAVSQARCPPLLLQVSLSSTRRMPM